ncbi:MAG: hypothetical protein MUC48_08585 [Leptolyngbya sp. Prado105]|nr:hypothetical protein [Leptolyngbya sp. Prado105]
MFLVQQKVRIGTRDPRISAISLSLNATVLTRNQRDFGQVPGLKLQDWTIYKMERDRVLILLEVYDRRF